MPKHTHKPTALTNRYWKRLAVSVDSLLRYYLGLRAGQLEGLQEFYPVPPSETLAYLRWCASQSEQVDPTSYDYTLWADAP